MAAPAVTQNYDTINVAAKSIRSHHQPFAADVNVLATHDGTPVIAPAKAGFTIYVTHISVAVLTDNAATLTFQDDTAVTPIPVAKTKASPGVGPIFWEFGELGIPIAEGKDLEMAISAAGLAARVHVEGYYKRTAVGSL